MEVAVASSEEIYERFDYHPPKDDLTREAHEHVRRLLRGVAVHFNYLLPDSREKSSALTALQEAMMWANGAIAIHGLDVESIPTEIRPRPDAEPQR
jgi:hypothetical protein